MAEMIGGHPLTRRLELAWAASSGPSGAWALVSSDRTWLRRVAERVEPSDADEPTTLDRVAWRPIGDRFTLDGRGDLATLPVRAAPRPQPRGAAGSVRSGSGVEPFLAQGWIRGDRLARHLAGWAAESEQFVPAGEAEALRRDLTTLAEALRFLREVHWVTQQIEAGVVGTAVEIRLAPLEPHTPGR
jgi:hypothetical protein